MKTITIYSKSSNQTIKMFKVKSNAELAAKSAVDNFVPLTNDQKEMCKDGIYYTIK